MCERHLVLGLDMGIASCGFALIDTSNHEILEMGSRLFPQPTVPKTGQSLAAVRRAKRSQRRNLDRAQARKRHLLRLLIEEGLVPGGASLDWFKMGKGDQRPILLRRDGLDRRLSNREWALVLYHLCTRRGYIPHGAGRDGDDPDAGKVKKALAANASMYGEGAPYRTVGEWMASLGPQGRNRNRDGNYDLCVTHAVLMDEARALFSVQRESGNPHASASLEAAYLEICDWQKDGSARDEATYGLVGRCIYFHKEKRAARSTLTNELLSAREKLGNIKLIGIDGVSRSLARGEIDAAMDLIFTDKPLKSSSGDHVTYKALRRALAIPSDLSFNMASDEKKVVYNPRGWRAFRHVLADRPDLLSRLLRERDLADAVAEAATYASSAPVLRARLDALDLTDGEIEALLALPFDGPAFNGYGSRGAEAARMLLEALEEEGVSTLKDAEEATGLLGFRLDGPNAPRARKLIPYEAYMHEVGDVNRNPVVLRAVAQARKVVNAVCSKWGVPHEIHMELARELKLPQHVRDEIARNNNRREKDRKLAREKIAEYGIPADRVKERLLDMFIRWEEQGGFDPYTGEKIEVSRLIHDENYCQVDHILPVSRTGDNSRSNKVLCLATSNQAKRERTPYEWMTSGEPGAPSWDGFAKWVTMSGKYHGRQMRNLLMQELDEVGFIDRNITDTAYMTRAMARYLEDCLEFPEGASKKPVVAVAGRATAWLRHQWGLGFGAMGEKDREDPRHHAVDACIIAACGRGTVMRTAKLSARRHGVSSEEKARILQGQLPWPSFASDVRAFYERASVSRFVERKGTGQAFEEFTYSFAGRKEKGGKVVGVRVGAKPKTIGNPWVSKDGRSVQVVGDMVCLRLWRDDDARAWYADPVYVADLPLIEDGAYQPRIAKQGICRDAWAPVPEKVLEEANHVELFLGDLFEIEDVRYVFEGYNIATAAWDILPIDGSIERKVPSIVTGLKDISSIKVLRSGLI